MQCSIRLGRSSVRRKMREYSLYFLITAIFTLSREVDAARILGLFPHTGKSHQMAFEPLLHKLAERGHHVTVASFFPSKNPPANYTDISFEGLTELGLETYDLSLYEDPNKIIKMIPPLDRLLEQMFGFAPLAEMALHNCRKLVDFKPLADVLKKEYDVLLIENFNSDCMLGMVNIYGHDAPIVGLSSTLPMPWSLERVGVADNPSYTPIPSTTFLDKMNFYERLENTFMKLFFKYWFRYEIQLKEQEIIEKHFGRRIPDLDDLARNTSLLILNCFRSWNGNRPLSSAIIEAGGMHLDHTRKALPHYMERYINESEHGVVLLSLGSLIKTATLPKYREQLIINALSTLKQRVIWKYEDSDEEGTLIGNILRVKWLPQYELLQHKNVLAFVTHGGMLGMTEAMSAGKPMVVVPFFGDQPNNGAHAAKLGIAKVVTYEHLTEKSLTDALQSVLSAEMRLNARRASQIWKDRQTSPMDTAVYAIERVIRWGAQDPLHLAARDLAFYQYYLLDVFAVAIISILVLLFLISSIFMLIVRSIIFILHREGKKKVN
uniref:UDP-glycosyltransferase UGT46D1 n=1 Tax=Zygaena filipendulae TaxID=287375 RepID=A0A286MXP6_9NEOP|nr:UDP-glycosyltransferase UGT46D1 [Zygaena filipendulae]